MESLLEARRLGVPLGIVSKQPLTWYTTPIVATTVHLGAGTYGAVYRYDIPSKNGAKGQVAVKISTAPPNEYMNGDYYGGVSPSLLKEMAVMSTLTHPNVIPLLDAFVLGPMKSVNGVVEMGGTMGLVLPYLPGGTLKEFIDRGSISMHTKKLIIAQLLRGVAYLHSMHVLHEDIKPQNVLLYNMTGSNDPVHCVLSDFGLASMHQCYGVSTVKSVAFSRWYSAPEVVLGERHDMGADSWALGCVIAEVLTGFPLLPGDSDIDLLHRMFRMFGTPTEETWPGVTKYNEWREDFPQLPRRKDNDLLPTLPIEARPLVIGLMQYVPSERTSPLDALDDEWLVEVLLDLNRGSLEAPPIQQRDCTTMLLSRQARTTPVAATVALELRLQLETRFRDKYSTKSILYAMPDRLLALSRQLANELLTPEVLEVIGNPTTILAVLDTALYMVSIVNNDMIYTSDLVPTWQRRGWGKIITQTIEQLAETILAMHGPDLYAATGYDVLEILLLESSTGEWYTELTAQAARTLLQCLYFTRVPLLYAPDCLAVMCLLLACSYAEDELHHVELVSRVGSKNITKAMKTLWDDILKLSWVEIDKDGNRQLVAATKQQRKTSDRGIALDDILMRYSTLDEMLNLVHV